jgi:hypothetical protein
MAGLVWAPVRTGTASAGVQAEVPTTVNARTAAVITATAMVTAPAVALVLADDAGCRRIRTARHHPFRQLRPDYRVISRSRNRQQNAGRAGIRPAGAGEPVRVHGWVCGRV